MATNYSIFPYLVAISFFISNVRLSAVSEEGGNIEVNNPGCYPTVCVELSIDCFAVNTVLQVRVECTAASCHSCCFGIYKSLSLQQHLSLVCSCDDLLSF